MQYPHCAHPDSISYGTSRGVEHYRYQACRRIFQTIRRGKDPALKQQACQLYLEGMEMRAIGRVLSIYHKTVSRWWCNLSKYSQQAQHRPKPARSSLKKIPMLVLATDRLQLWQGPRLCLWKKDDQNR